MALVDDKTSIINQIGVFSSVGKQAQLPNSNTTLPSLNNTNDPVPFLLDTLTVMVGSTALQKTTGQVTTDFIGKAEPQLKTSLINQTTTHNSNQTIPSPIASNGISIPAKNIDLYGKLKTDPSSNTGGLIYGDNPTTMDKALYNSMQTPNTDVTHGSGNGAVTLNYDKATDTVKVKPVVSSQTIGTFIAAFIGGMILIDQKEFTSKIIEAIFGTVSADQKKSLSQLIQEEKINTTIDKIINNESNLNLTPTDLLNVEDTANQKLNGVSKVDVGCSIIDSDVSINDLKTLIMGNTGTTNPLQIGQNYANLISNSFGKNPAQTNPSNKNAINDGFFKKIISTVKSEMTKATTVTPQIQILMAFVSAFKNNGDISGALGNPVNNIIGQKNTITCLSSAASSALHEFIFSLVKTELIKLIVPVATVILQEKIQAYTGIINSLV